MGYRVDIPKVKPEDALPRYAVRNGATAKLTFDCFYFKPQPGHDPHYHDYINWPSHDYHPGAVCQMVPPREPFPHAPMPIMRTEDDLVPIMLTTEGYNEFKVVFDDTDEAEYLDADVYIDEDLDYVIHADITTSFPMFKDKPKDLRFTLFAGNKDGMVDAVAHAFLTVLPGSPF